MDVCWRVDEPKRALGWMDCGLLGFVSVEDFEFDFLDLVFVFFLFAGFGDVGDGLRLCLDALLGGGGSVIVEQ